MRLRALSLPALLLLSGCGERHADVNAISAQQFGRYAVGSRVEERIRRELGEARSVTRAPAQGHCMDYAAVDERTRSASDSLTYRFCFDRRGVLVTRTTVVVAP